MATMLVRFKVQDYDAFRPQFESGAETRKRFGCTGTHLFRNLDDPNEVTINLQWDTLENARRFLASDERRQALQRAGVIGEPEVWFVEDAGRTPS
ncbi:MAG TPA: antibiotic biosynthesis monooxygenase [Dehalococcoidia bacterium]|nr:antibiotic biosynthesis monooxygenase [Dehalococcoidia bacterium]